jgi:hypothetical protein
MQIFPCVCVLLSHDLSFRSSAHRLLHNDATRFKGLEDWIIPWPGPECSYVQVLAFFCSVVWVLYGLNCPVPIYCSFASASSIDGFLCGAPITVSGTAEEAKPWLFQAMVKLGLVLTQASLFFPVTLVEFELALSLRLWNLDILVPVLNWSRTLTRNFISLLHSVHFHPLILLLTSYPNSLERLGPSGALEQRCQPSSCSCPAYSKDQ